MDNAPWHKKMYRLVVTENRDEYADIRESVVFVMLPPYSPDLNPIEQVWRITRRENTHNTFFNSLASLKSTVDKAFSRWSVPNAQLRSLCS
jgi:transposase